MKDGTILSTAKHFIWYNPLTWLPFLIRTVTKDMVSHSAVIINIDGVPFVAESKVPKVVLESWETWRKQKMDIYMTTSESVPEDFRMKVLSKIGNSKYDYRLLFFTQPIYQLTGWWIPTKQGQKGEPFTCSEFVAYSLGINEPWKKVPGDLIKDNYELIH
jgi:hypothetical protein